jgi:hypothetical protein
MAPFPFPLPSLLGIAKINQQMAREATARFFLLPLLPPGGPAIKIVCLLYVK